MEGAVDFLTQEVHVRLETRNRLGVGFECPRLRHKQEHLARTRVFAHGLEELFSGLGLDAILGCLTRSEPPFPLSAVSARLVKDCAAYDKVGESSAEDEAVEYQHVDVVLPFYNPSRNGQTHAEVLLAVRVPILFPVLADFVVGQTG